MQKIKNESRMQEVTERRHITEQMWTALSEDTISQDDYIRLLEHTGECSFCAERLAEVFLKEDVADEPPVYLAEQILERTKQLDVQAAVTIRQTSKKLQLFMYSLKVGAAVAFSLVILGLTANFQDVGFVQLEIPGLEQDITKAGQEASTVEKRVEKESVLDKMNDAAGSMTDKMNAFANEILNGGNKK